MKNSCHCALRECLSDCLAQARCEEILAQSRLSMQFSKDTSPCVSFYHNDDLCCMQTFVLFLASLGDDTNALIYDMERVILKYRTID